MRYCRVWGRTSLPWLCYTNQKCEFCSDAKKKNISTSAVCSVLRRNRSPYVLCARSVQIVAAQLNMCHRWRTLPAKRYPFQSLRIVLCTASLNCIKPRQRHFVRITNAWRLWSRRCGKAIRDPLAPPQARPEFFAYRDDKTKSRRCIEVAVRWHVHGASGWRLETSVR